MGSTITSDTIRASCEAAREHSREARSAAQQAVERAKQTVKQSRAIIEGRPPARSKTPKR